MVQNRDLNLHWQQFIKLACARFAASTTGIGIDVAPLLLAAGKINPDWNQRPNALSLETSILALDDQQLRSSMAAIVPYLTWIERGVFCNSQDVNRAYIELVGPKGVLRNDQFRFGIYWQQANTFYPKHRHDALELYHIVSGTALRQIAEQPFKARLPGTSFEHLNRIDHAALTRDEDLLALWAWRGDLSFDNYTMDS